MRVILILGVFSEKNQAFNRTFTIIFTMFGNVNKSIMRMRSSQPVKGLVIQGVIHARFFLNRSATSHEKKVVNFQTQEEVTVRLSKQ